MAMHGKIELELRDGSLERIYNMSREVPLLVRLYLRLWSTPSAMAGWGLATFLFVFALLAAAKVHDSTLYSAWFATGILSLIGMLALCFVVHAGFAAGKTIRLLQNGIATHAKFFGVNLAGTRIDSTIAVDFEYQVEGETYTVSTQAFSKSRLTINTSTLVFYDSMLPKQAVVLDNNIGFDETTGRYYIDPLHCALPLLLATVVVGAIVAIAVFVLSAI